MYKEENLRIEAPSPAFAARALTEVPEVQPRRAPDPLVGACIEGAKAICITRSRRPFGFLFGIAALGAPFAQAVSAGAVEASMSFEQRLGCRIQLEDLRWSHTIWPESNAEPKPKRMSVVTDSEISAQVEDGLRMETALRARYGIVIDESALQIELNRIALSSRAPEQLREQFDALGNDGNLIAECLIRPLLVARHIRNAYAFDDRLHGELRDRAKSVLSAGSDPATLNTDGSVESTVAYSLDEGSPAEAQSGNARSHEVRVDSETMAVLRSKHRKSASFEVDTRVPAAPGPGLNETPEAFVYSAVVHDEHSRIVISHRAWRKKPFDAWWAVERAQRQLANPVLTKSIKVPRIYGAANPIDKAAVDTWWLPMQTPSARSYHTAIWTGVEMIVWGGALNFGYLDSGARYDPSSDTWRPISMEGAPSPRAAHTAIWTGSQMIVWGGHFYNGIPATSGPLGTGARYDLSTDSWTALPMQGAPSPRSGHTAVWIDGEMFVLGGARSDGARFSLASGSWSPISTNGAPSARLGESVTWTGSELVVWGGDVPDSQIGSLATGARYNPSTDSWTAMSIAGAPPGRRSHSAVWTGSEVVVWGGYINSVQNITSTGARYHPATNSWIPLPSAGAPAGRFAHTAVWIGNEMFVWGGSVANFFGWVDSNTGARFNVLTNSWSPTTALGAPIARSGHTAIVAGEQVIIWGGSANEALDSGARYLPNSDQWVAMIRSTPGQLAGSTEVWTGREMLVWGGFDPTGYTANGFRYDPVFDQWTATRTVGAPLARWEHTAVWTGSEMIVWGGYEQTSGRGDTGGRYRPSSDTWTATSLADAPAARWFHSAIWTGSEMIVWGGYFQESSIFDSGGRYHPSSDTWVATSGVESPSPRRSHTAVWTGTEMLVWGGTDGNVHPSAGGRYDPLANQWQPISSIGSPTPRSDHTAVWSGSEMLVWGGPERGGRYAPTTDSWIPMATVNEPARRIRHTAVWTDSEMIVWGGYIDPPHYMLATNTGSRYSPAEDRWLPVPLTNAPQARSGHVAVWTGSEMVIFGGGFYSASLSDHAVYRPYGPFPSRLFSDGFETP